MIEYYTVVFKEPPRCWSCGEEIKEGTLIEWQHRYEKEILCDACLGQLFRNEKEIKILATFHGWRNKATSGGRSG